VKEVQNMENVQNVKNVHFQKIVHTLKNGQVFKNVQISKYVQICKIVQVLKNGQILNFLGFLGNIRKNCKNPKKGPIWTKNPDREYGTAHLFHGEHGYVQRRAKKPL
jgi:hypothetical protein